jgi:phosphoadenosine phosphosulfate reductase
MTLDGHTLAEANKRLANADSMTVLEWTRDTFGDEVGMTTAFGYSGLALLHQALQIMPELKIYFIDTGFHFAETLEFSEQLTEEWKLNLDVLRPFATKEEVEERVGKEPHRVNADLCCHYCKVEPLLRVIHSRTAWLSGIRRDQNRTRAGIQPIELDGRGVIKISPMGAWTKEQTWDYIREHNISCSPLHDKGYLSIGCKPCTTPVGKGGDERDGRWPFMLKTECGIHLR